MGQHTCTLSQRRLKRRTETRSFARDLPVGAGNTAIDRGCCFFLTALFTVPACPAQSVGYAAGAVNSCAPGRRIVFHSARRFFSRELFPFALLTALTALSSSLLIGLVAVRWGFSGASFQNFAAKAGVTAFTTLFSFSFSRLWVFRSETA